MLQNLSDADKKDLLQLLAAIEETFSLYWRHYSPYNKLENRNSKLDTLLHDQPTDDSDGWTFLCFHCITGTTSSQRQHAESEA